MADGETIADPDWEPREGHYRVRLDNKWVDVSDEAVITEPNRRYDLMNRFQSCASCREA
jgi:hypothetical protein